MMKGSALRLFVKSKGRRALITLTGALLAVSGMSMVVGAALVVSGASADTAPYELYCPGTPIGDVAINGVVTTGDITPANPGPGDSFSITNYQTTVSIPQSPAQAASAIQPSLTGSASTTIDATGATPATTSQGPFDFNVPIPDPVPADGVALALPSAPATVTGFTASSGSITVSEDQSASLTLDVAGTALTLTCTAFPNDSVPSGITSSPPSGNPISPVIAQSGSGTTTTTVPPVELTGPYELYCPGTPIGDVAINDVTTTATMSPPSPTVGQTFQLTNYQTTVNIPQSLAEAASAIQPNLTGSASTQIDAAGATPAATPQGPFDFNVPIPDPVPGDGVALALPSTPATVNGFTATSSDITIEEDPSASLTLDVAGSPLSLTCTAYPNNSVPSGISSTPPTEEPVAPVIAATVPPPPTTTTTTTPSVPPVSGQTEPYELYCPNTPVGDIALNDVVTSGGISPGNPSPGSTFDVTGYQVEVVIPAAIVSAAAALGNSAIQGEATSKLDVEGATPATLSTPELTFDVPIPDPVPAAGLTLDIPSPAVSMGPFTATSDSVTVAADESTSLTLVVSGNNLPLECTAYANNTVPISGIVTPPNTLPPSATPISPVIVTTGPAETTTTTTTTTLPATSTTTGPPGSTTTEVSPPTTSGSSSQGGNGSGGATTAASSSSLAFTGAGPGVRWVAAIGAALLLIGLVLVGMGDAPRRMLRRIAYLQSGRGA